MDPKLPPLIQSHAFFHWPRSQALDMPHFHYCITGCEEVFRLFKLLLIFVGLGAGSSLHCVGNSLVVVSGGLLSGRDAQVLAASSSCCGAQASGCTGFSSRGAWA